MTKDLEYYMGLPYRVEVVEDKEEGGFALRCPELSGCVTAAATVEEGFRQLEDAKRGWFSACLEDGVTIPEPAQAEEIINLIKYIESGEKEFLPKQNHK